MSQQKLKWSIKIVCCEHCYNTVTSLLVNTI